MRRKPFTTKRSRSLRSVVLLHNAAFLFLIAVTSIAGIYGSWFWQQSSRESLRLNTLVNEALEIRGDIFREIKEISTARLVNDPTALDRYWRHLYQIDQRFYRLEKQNLGEDGMAAIKTMRHSYEIMQSEMNKLFAENLTGYSTDRQLIDDVYQNRILGDFENAFNTLRKHIRNIQQSLEAKLDYWSELAPYIVGLPVLLALGLLLYSRYVFRHQFIQPMDELAKGALGISAGKLQRRIPVQGVQEVVSLTESINDMAEQLEVSRDTLVEHERQAALGALVPVVAHNIRNPLASIRATAQVLEYADSKTDRSEAQHAIISTVDRLERWVSSLLSYLNPLKPVTKTIALTAITDQTVQALDNRLQEKQLQIERHNWDTIIHLEVDEALLEQALYGLLTNAVEASSQGGKISLGIEVSNNIATLLIDDNGPGMPFEPKPTDLSPGPSTKRFGTGLGIPFAFKIVKAHAGQLIYESAPQGGTRVRLELPTQAS
jgi:signal transduction histidine kinase